MNAVTDTPVTEMPAPFVFTDAAAEKVKQLIDEEGNPDLKLRVFDPRTYDETPTITSGAKSTQGGTFVLDRSALARFRLRTHAFELAPGATSFVPSDWIDGDVITLPAHMRATRSSVSRSQAMPGRSGGSSSRSQATRTSHPSAAP